MNLSFQPLRQLQASLSGRYEHGLSDSQWIENRDADGDGRDDNVYGTLYMVWNLSQSDSTRPGQFGAFRDIGSAFGADASTRSW